MTTINRTEQALDRRDQQHPLTSREQLEYVRRCVKWTLWKIATTPPVEEAGPMANLIAEIGQKFFQDPAWIADVMAGFILNNDATSLDRSVDYTAFLGLDQAQERRKS